MNTYNITSKRTIRTKQAPGGPLAWPQCIVSVVSLTNKVIPCAIAALLCCSLARTSHAEDSDPATPITWTVQVDPLTTALGIAHVLFERKVSDQWAVYAGPSMRLYDSPLTPDDEEGYRAHGMEAGARWFFRGGAPSGWWTGLRGVVAHMTFAGEARLGGYVSALAGRAWILGGRWILSAALGVSYFDYSVGGVGVEGVLPAAHTGVGVVF